LGHDDAPDAPAPTRDSVDRFYGAVGSATRLSLRAMTVVANGMERAARRVRPQPAPGPEPDPDAPTQDDRTSVETAEVLALGAVAIGAEVARRVFAGAAWAAAQAEHGATALMQHPPLRRPVERLTDAAESWDERARNAVSDGQQAATDRGLDLAAQIATRIVDRLDIDAIVNRVDIERILARVDLNEVAGRLDVNAVAARLDVEQVIGRLDLPAIAEGVIDQLDLTAIAQRIINELDLTTIAEEVIDEVELSEIIRESTGTVTVDAVDALRVGGMHADRLVARVVDRLLMRRNGSVPSDPPVAPGAPGAPPPAADGTGT
jgi:hypothetical protein